ncbi:MAG: C39 family peptidase [Candidatus Kerfeldbacteria bacterium]|nr:C39 family peptidase [Candidatus Kerfeldbacteria bacterium]
MRRREIVIGAVVVFIVGASLAFFQRVAIRDAFTGKPDVPAAVERAAVVADVNANTGNTNTAGEPEPLPVAVNLKVPFTSQAPDANWDQDHEEFCEEAAVLMVGRYWQDRTIEGKSDAEAALQEIKTFELKEFGFYYDTTAAETARILENLYGLRVEIIADPSLDDIKRAVASGNPVIVPTAGRQLGNPNFRRPGPVYHNLVIKGYTADGKLITNDPGTRKGADYLYSAEVVLNAMHDWVPAGERTVPRNGDVGEGRKVVIVVRGS